MRIRLSTFWAILAVILLAFGWLYVKVVKADEAQTKYPTRLEVMLQEDYILTAVPGPTVLTPEEKSSQSYLHDTPFGSEIHFYDDPEVQKKVADFKEKYGTSVISPLFDVNTETGEKTENLLWTAREIGIILDEVPHLPSIYLDRKWKYFPKTIVLIKPAGTGGGPGGGSGADAIWFFLPANFDPDGIETGVDGLLYGTDENKLKGVVDHEWTHNHQFNSPKFLTRWEKETGWLTDADGLLTKTIPNEFEGQIYGLSKEYSNEDQATAVMIFRFDPNRLNDAQRNFIMKEFPNWPPVIEFLNNPPRN